MHDVLVIERHRRNRDSDDNCGEGWELQGRPRTVLLRGEVVIEDGDIVGSRTGGAFLPRSTPPEIVQRPPDPVLTAPRKGAFAGTTT